MKNFLSKDDLGNDLLFQTLQALSQVFSSIGLDLTIVGASARDLAMKLLDSSISKRRTADLDVAVALNDWNQYQTLSDALTRNHFKKLTPKQKFAYKGPNRDNDYEVDVVPFGNISSDELIKWPPMGCPEMSVRCYDDVMAKAMDVNIAGIHVKIAPLAGQFLIKLDTWIDRNNRETKDAIDMRFILSQFYMATVMNSDFVPDVVNLEEGTELLWGAQWIAFETSQMLSTEHLAYYVEFLGSELEKGEKSRLLQHLNIGHEERGEDWQRMQQAMQGILKIWKAEIDRRRREE